MRSLWVGTIKIVGDWCCSFGY